MARTPRGILLAGAAALVVGALLPWARTGEAHRLAFGFGHGAEGVLALGLALAATAWLGDVAWALVTAGLALLWVFLVWASMADGLLDPGTASAGLQLVVLGATAVAAGTAWIVAGGLRDAALRALVSRGR
jgi:hypothetical protein